MDPYLKNALEFPAQLGYQGLVLENFGALKDAKTADGLIIAGMGGSALASEVLKSCRKETGLRVPVCIWRDYGLPDPADYGLKNPLYVFVSFSGNTEETVSGLRALLASKLPRAGVAVIATGGELAKAARAKDLALVSFPAGDLQPRQATGRMFYGLIEILFASRLIRSRVPSYTHLKPARTKAAGKRLAAKLKDRLTVVYADEASRDLGYFWKIRINETGKTQAFANVVPEMNHNELVGYEKPVAKTVALFLHEKPTGRMAKRLAINKRLLKKHGVQVIDLPLPGKTRLERTWESIMFADWTTYFLAGLYGVEAGPVPIVEGLKKLMQTP
jgi:glucose/mannose-6-phosphate isomerase